MASDLAIPVGRTGMTFSAPAAYADATGAQPSPWAPCITGAGPGAIRPAVRPCSNPCRILV